MYPTGLARLHPAAETLQKYATRGCPVETGKQWTINEIEAAIARGPHPSALVPEAMLQLENEVKEKVAKGQARLLDWETLKREGVPPELKISPIAMIPHKSRAYRAILDLSFGVRLKEGSRVPSVNQSTTLTAPAGSIDQLGHSLSRIIHAFAEAGEDEKVFSVKYDIKDGFWRLHCQQGEEYNFAYVLPQAPGKPIKLVVPSALQMGWVESPAYFCAASETARDVATHYIETPIGSIEEHKFVHHAMSGSELSALPETDSSTELKYAVEVYVDDFIPIAIASSREQLRHVANGILHGIHDVFPSNPVDDEDPISMKKILKGDGVWALQKDILGFTFNGDTGKKTIQLEKPKREFLLEALHRWIRTARTTGAPVPFLEFESVVAKLRHAFIAIPAGVGLLSVCNKLLGKRPTWVHLSRNQHLLHALMDCRSILREATTKPTPCEELVAGWPHYVGVKDASKHGVGGVIIGEDRACTPTVFRVEWPDDIKRSLVSEANPTGTITNSDLEMAGLLLLWLAMEEVCQFTPGAHVALFSDNSPTVHWVRRMAARGSRVASQLLRALALRLKIKQVSPLTPLHIPGERNRMTDIPSRSFGSEPKWHCTSDSELLTLFNAEFPLPNQKSWTVFRLSQEIFTKVLSVLRMQPTGTDAWRRLPATGKFVGGIGAPTAHLWEWTLTYRGYHTRTSADTSWGSREQCAWDATVAGARSEVEQHLRRSRPLGRRSPWTRG
jgi:hypothetical protein